jgi:hypothetical protein
MVVATVALAACSSAGVLGSASPLAGGGDVRQSVARAAQTVSVTPAGRSVMLPGTIVAAVHSAAGPGFVMGNPLRQPRVFLSDDANNVVDIYDPNDKQLVGQLTGFDQPQGLATSRDGTLYVADTGNSQVEVYDQPYSTTPSETLADTGEYPAAVAVSDRGVLAVVNMVDTTGKPGNVIFYP